MQHLLFCAPATNSYSAKPLDPIEIDQHPDSARIWATVRELRDTAMDYTSEAQEDMLKSVEDDAKEQGFQACAELLDGLSISIESDNSGNICFSHNITCDKAGEISLALDSALDKLAYEISDRLETLADDIARLSTAKANGSTALAKLREQIDIMAETKKLDWSTRRDLRDGRYSTESLSRILKKDELAEITVIAMRALFGMMKVR